MPRQRRSPRRSATPIAARCISIRRSRASWPSGSGRRPRPASSAEPLTDREKEVLSLVAQGLSNKDIAARAVHHRADRQDVRQQHPGQAGLAESDPGGALGAGPRPWRSSRLKELRQYQAAPLHPWRAASGLMASLCWARVKRSQFAARLDARGRAIGDDGRRPRHHPTRHGRGSGGRRGSHPSGAAEPARPRLAWIPLSPSSAST